MGSFCNMCTKQDVDQSGIRESQDRMEKPQDRKARKNKARNDSEEIPSEIVFDNNNSHTQ